MKWTSLLLLGAVLVGCKSTYQVRNYHAPAVQIRPEEGVYIIVPEDGPDEPGSGGLAAGTLQALFRHYAQRIRQSEEIAPVSIHLTNAAAAGFVYVLKSKIHLWKEEATGWSGLRDKLDINLRLLRVPGGEVVSEARVQGQSAQMGWTADRVEHLLKGIGGKWVGALYGRSEFQTQNNEDKAKK